MLKPSGHIMIETGSVYLTPSNTVPVQMALVCPSLLVKSFISLYTSPAWMQALNCASMVSYENTNSFYEVRAPAEDRNWGLLYRLTASRQTGA